MINALKNLFREKVVSNSIQADEALAYSMDIGWAARREANATSRLKAEVALDRFRNAASIGDTFDYLGVECVVTGLGVNDNYWVGTGRHSAYLNYQSRDKDLCIVRGQFSSDSIDFFESLAWKVYT